MAVNYPRPYYSFSDRPRFSNFCFSRFPQSVTESHQASSVPRSSSYSVGRDFFSHHQAGYRSSFRQPGSFFVPNFCYTQLNGSGGLRVILNLKAINVFIPPQHFRMETLVSILPTISPQDWAHLLGSQGCIPPRSYSSEIAQTSRFSIPESHIPLSGSPPLVFGIPPGFLPVSLPLETSSFHIFRRFFFVPSHSASLSTGRSPP